MIGENGKWEKIGVKLDRYKKNIKKNQFSGWFSNPFCSQFSGQFSGQLNSRFTGGFIVRFYSWFNINFDTFISLKNFHPFYYEQQIESK
jgi:hypothetical protein